MKNQKEKSYSDFSLLYLQLRHFSSSELEDIIPQIIYPTITETGTITTNHQAEIILLPPVLLNIYHLKLILL
jgi:hypothetical protein